MALEKMFISEPTIYLSRKTCEPSSFCMRLNWLTGQICRRRRQTPSVSTTGLDRQQVRRIATHPQHHAALDQRKRDGSVVARVV
jgi:hypothetical protein